jgi:hypothetical protein
MYIPPVLLVFSLFTSRDANFSQIPVLDLAGRWPVVRTQKFLQKGLNKIPPVGIFQ